MSLRVNPTFWLHLGDASLFGWILQHLAGCEAAGPFMRILLQNTHTLKYIRRNAEGAPQWTRDVRRARNFTHALAAIFFCYGTCTGDMQLCIEFSDSRQSFCVPVANARCS